MAQILTLPLKPANDSAIGIVGQFQKLARSNISEETLLLLLDLSDSLCVEGRISEQERDEIWNVLEKAADGDAA